MPKREPEPTRVSKPKPLTIVIRRADLILDGQGKPLNPQPEQEIVQIIELFK
jgi:1,6-anhydro-N-acetylmuramate kinase